MWCLQKRANITIKANKKNIKNLSNKELTNDQVNLLVEGLKFIPTPVTKQTQIRRQPLHDFDRFTRRMCLMYIFQRENKEPHPYHVKSTRKPPVQHSVALESYCIKGCHSIFFWTWRQRPVSVHNSMRRSIYNII